jgi:hypothetical protein
MPKHDATRTGTTAEFEAGPDVASQSTRVGLRLTRRAFVTHAAPGAVLLIGCAATRGGEGTGPDGRVDAIGDGGADRRRGSDGRPDVADQTGREVGSDASDGASDSGPGDVERRDAGDTSDTTRDTQTTSHRMRDLLAAAGITGLSGLPPDKVWPTTFLSVDDLPYGAKGDGTTDDTNAIVTCLTAARAGGHGVTFGAGKTYLMNSKISPSIVTGWNSMLWKGNGATIKIGNGVGLTGDSFLQPTRCRGVRIYDLTIDGNRAGRGNREAFGAHSIQPSSCHDFAMVRCRSNNAPCDGWRIYAQGPVAVGNIPTWNALIDCHAHNCSRVGASLIQSIDCYIVGGSYNGTKGTAPAAGIDIEPTSLFDSTGISIVRANIIRVEFSDNYHDGIHLANLGSVRYDGLVIKDCLFQRNCGRTPESGRPQSHAALYVGIQCTKGEIRNNVFRDHKTANAGTLVRGTAVYFGPNEKGSWVIDGNKFERNSAFEAGVTVSGANVGCHPRLTTFSGGVNITNNHIDIRGTGRDGINVPGSKPTGNTCLRLSTDGTAFHQNPGGNTTIVG